MGEEGWEAVKMLGKIISKRGRYVVRGFVLKLVKYRQTLSSCFISAHFNISMFQLFSPLDLLFGIHPVSNIELTDL